MLAWYVNDSYKLNLDEKKLFTYALAHDLVEVYAGDVHFFDQTEEVSKAKHAREVEAAARIRKEFPEFNELHEAIERYERKEDKEAKFIYALDKIEPVLSIYRDGGRTWKKNKVTLEMLTTNKFPKILIDSTVKALFDELVIHLTEADKQGWFWKE